MNLAPLLKTRATDIQYCPSQLPGFRAENPQADLHEAAISAGKVFENLRRLPGSESNADSV